MICKSLSSFYALLMSSSKHCCDHCTYWIPSKIMRCPIISFFERKQCFFCDFKVFSS